MSGSLPHPFQRISRARRWGPAALAAVLLLSGCASAQEEDDSGALLGYEEPNDPLEIPNRFVFAINETLDTFILKPIAVTYRFWMPDPLQDVVRNFARNVASPVILANDVFQGEWDRAEDTLARFVANTATTGGLGDVVPERHPYHDEDFGQTLAVYGADDGFYLVLPLLGPSSARDAAGRGVDVFLNPLFYVEDGTLFSVAVAGARAVDTRARNIELIEDLKRDSVDYYARVRSLYYQRRKAEIENRAANVRAAPLAENKSAARESESEGRTAPAIASNE